MADRVILHIDMNNFYATVECKRNPQLKDVPFAVGGSAELRHGIVLSKNGIAKSFGVKTGESLQEARKKCPNLITVPADIKEYIKYSREARDIYDSYTHRVESFGIDECWLDVTGLDGKAVAEEIRERIKKQLGLTVSVGVSWNKVYAKLGSDMKKPDATTVISRENYRERVFPLPSGELLYVGRATKKKLEAMNIFTIGDIASADASFLRNRLGKWGEYLHVSASGADNSEVHRTGFESVIESIGNSTTPPRDLVNIEDVRILVTRLSESVAQRLRENRLKGLTVYVSVRDKFLSVWGVQHKMKYPTNVSGDIIKTAMDLFVNNYKFDIPIRSIGVRVSDLSFCDCPVQLDLFDPERVRQCKASIESTVDKLRARYGRDIIRRAVEISDPRLSGYKHNDDDVAVVAFSGTFALTKR